MRAAATSRAIGPRKAVNATRSASAAVALNRISAIVSASANLVWGVTTPSAGSANPVPAKCAVLRGDWAALVLVDHGYLPGGSQVGGVTLTKFAVLIHEGKEVAGAAGRAIVAQALLSAPSSSPETRRVRDIDVREIAVAE